MSWMYALLAGVVGGIVSLILTGVIYAATPSLLFNPATQSAKVIGVYKSILPLPLSTTDMAAFAVGWILLAMVRTLVLSSLYRSVPGIGYEKD